MVRVTSSFMSVGDVSFRRLTGSNRWQPQEVFNAKRELENNDLDSATYRNALKNLARAESHKGSSYYDARAVELRAQIATLKAGYHTAAKAEQAAVDRYGGKNYFSQDEAYEWLKRYEAGDPMLVAKDAAYQAKRDEQQAAVIETYKAADAAADGKLVGAAIISGKEDATLQLQSIDYQNKFTEVQKLPVSSVAEVQQAIEQANPVPDAPAPVLGQAVINDLNQDTGEVVTMVMEPDGTTTTTVQPPDYDPPAGNASHGDPIPAGRPWAWLAAAAVAVLSIVGLAFLWPKNKQVVKA